MTDKDWSTFPDSKPFYSHSKPGIFCPVYPKKDGWRPFEAASGHPGGWRVVSMPNNPNGCGMRELSNRHNRPILFKTREAAQRRAEQLNKSP